MNFREAVIHVIGVEVLGPDWVKGKTTSQIYEATKNSKAVAAKGDLGGLTKFGISKKSYPNLDIAGLTIEQAISIYKRDFWDKIMGDQIKFFPVAYAIFDQAINRGVVTAIINAQKVVGVKQDGVMGPMTLAAINAKTDENFRSSFLDISEQSYRNIVLNNPSQAINLSGWLKRVSGIKSYTDSFIGVVSQNKGISAGVVAMIAIFFLIILNQSKRKA